MIKSGLLQVKSKGKLFSRVLPYSIENQNFYINFGNAKFGGNFKLIWGATLGHNFEVSVMKLHEKEAVSRRTWIPTQPWLKN